MKKSRSITTAFLLLTLTAYAEKAGHAQAARPRTVVITNDDGIQERDRFMPMAEAFSKFADTYVVVPSTERSGSTNTVTWAMWNKRVLEVELISKRPATEERRSLTVYAVDGYPADCVLFALVALLGGSPPDLLVSGPNVGSNLGRVAWMFSGTIGAARVAAALGVPAMAVSDVGEDRPEEENRAVGDWVAKFAESSFVQELEPGQYLTVALPREIRGVKLAQRARWVLPRGVQAPELEGRGSRGGMKEAWLLQPPLKSEPPHRGTDRDLWRQGYAVITTMRADEQDPLLMEKLKRRMDEIPTWKP
jgi:5'-nucleotidase